jgi:hypothetical protein
MILNFLSKSHLSGMRLACLTAAGWGLLYICLLVVPGCSQQYPSKTFGNADLLIELAINPEGIPYISKVISAQSNKVFLSDATAGAGLQDRLENESVEQGVVTGKSSGWEITEDSSFFKATAPVQVGSANVFLHVELLKKAPVFTTWFSIKSENGTIVKTFPIYSSDLGLADSTALLTWWKAVDFTRQQQIIDNDMRLVLQSRIHSSDNTGGVAGNVPYWTLQSGTGSIGFSLAWCGGWTNELSSTKGIMHSDVYLPASETQLKLAPGEEMAGPRLMVFCSEDTNPVLFRTNWLAARNKLAETLYPQPIMGFPLIYNHWYAVKFDLSESFIKNQVKWFSDYGFNVFMVDAGWYKNVGSWTPNAEKFSPEEFQRSIHTIKSYGAIAGLWSCPHLIVVKEPLPSFIDHPGRYVPFMNAWLVDYNAMDYSRFLNLHLDTLVNQLGAGWWKSDQEYFAENPRSGKLKSVMAFQNAYSDARKAYPKLIFESCMGGGKMINEFTDQISQIHWIRDGERTGYIHAVTNIYEAMGAAEFLSLQKVQRWNNRIDETDMDNPELLKFYCRSCMVGTWGISADLNKISQAQKNIILSETQNYRRLNELKAANIVEFDFPGEYTNLVPVTFYDASLKKAGVILYQMFPRNVSARINLKTQLDPSKQHILEDVDGQTTKTVQGNTFNLTLKPGQLSGVFFIRE